MKKIFSGLGDTYKVASDSGATGWELFGWTMLGIFGGAVLGGAIGAAVGAAAPAIGSFLGSSFTFGGFAFAGGQAAAVTVTGAQIAAGAVTLAAGLAVLFSKGNGPRMGHNQYENKQFHDAMNELDFKRTDPEWWEIHNALQNEPPMKYKDLIKFIKNFLGIS